MEKLNILQSQFAVGKAEYSTGIILEKNVIRYPLNLKIENTYEVFETYQLAKTYAIDEVNKNPNIECFIINSKNEIIFCFDQKGERLIK